MTDNRSEKNDRMPEGRAGRESAAGDRRGRQKVVNSNRARSSMTNDLHQAASLSELRNEVFSGLTGEVPRI